MDRRRPAAGLPLAPPSPADVGATGTWVDANRKVVPVAGDNCYLDTPESISDIAVGSNPDIVFFAASSSEAIFFTTNNLASEAAEKPAGAANGNQPRGRLALDPENPNRLWSVCGGCPYGNSATIYTEDGFGTTHWIRPTAFDWTFTDGPRDLDFKAGTVLEAGNSGMIVTSTNGRDFYLQPADGALGTHEWRSVGLANATLGAVGGADGKLVVSATTNSIPDATAPTGTIGGPSTGATGQPLAFTSQIADEAGGSGINAAATNWSTPGLTNQPGANASFTFPNPGTFVITLSFADNAGNTGTAAKTVTITGAGQPTLPTFTLPSSSNPPVAGGAATRKGRFVRVKVKGKLTPPSGVPSAQACAGRVTATLLKGKKKLVSKKIKLRKNCRYKKTLKVKRKKVGKAKSLKLRIAFGGNATIGKSKATYTVPVR